jgi:Peptidase family M48
MMDVSTVFLPLIAAAFVTVLATGLHKTLPPKVAARVVFASMLVVAAAALPSIWIIGVSYLAHAPLIGKSFRWCAMAFGLHHEIPAILAIPALGVTIHGGLGAFAVLRRDRHLRIHGPGPVEFIESQEAFAATMPGKGGRIIVSTALVELVDDQEFDIVIAHERAHAQNRHDRYLLWARLVSAALPFMRPVTRRLHFVLERWADETAAARCGDRTLVATTLAKVALNEPVSSPLALAALSFSGLGVVGRVEALLAPPRPRPARPYVAGIWLATAVATVLAVVQLHHLAGLISALCPT